MSAAATIRSEGGLLPRDVLARIAELDSDLGGLTPDSYHLATGERLGEAIARSWSRLIGAWEIFASERDQLPTGDHAGKLTRERWLLPLLAELGYGRIVQHAPLELDGRSYPVFAEYQHSPVHLIGAGVPLDRRTAGVRGAAEQSPHSLVQELLNRSPERLWGVVTNGLSLRLLRDNVTLTRQAYVEFDLESIMASEAYEDFALLWLCCHQSRVEAERPEESWLELWTQAAERDGARALGDLRVGVERAIEVLGGGFLAQPANQQLHSDLGDGTLDGQSYYRELLRIVYRLLFLFVAEDRDVLLLPENSTVERREARRRFVAYYGTVRLRRLASRRRGGRAHDLYEQIKLLTNWLHEGGQPVLALPALGSALWESQTTPHLHDARLGNDELLEAIRELAFVRDSRRPVDFRHLGTEELGSVYESLLELHPVIDRHTSGFRLASAAGHERKQTGSYYTPSNLIGVLLGASLDPALEDAASGPDPEDRILALRVCDPACGSGHFLIAAANRIAKRLASVREHDPEPAPDAVRTALRDVVSHCIHGVDVNPMAVELCKVSLWLEALEPGRPLSFLDNRILCGNSVLGATPALVAEGVPDGAFTVREGDDAATVKRLRRQNQRERKGQRRLDDDLVALASSLATDAAAIPAGPDDSVAAVHAREDQFHMLVASDSYRRAKMLGDAWCLAFLGVKSADTPEITSELLVRVARGEPIAENARVAIANQAAAHRFFHWHVEFPAVYRAADDDAASPEVGAGGFDVVLGNPPFVNAIEGGVPKRVKALLRATHPEVGGTADLAVCFLAAASSLVRPGGWVAMVQPRAVLNASPAEALRGHLPNGLQPNLLYAPNRSDFFAGPSVFVALVVLGPERTCRVSKDDVPTEAVWTEGAINDANWWYAIEQLLGGHDAEQHWDGPTVGEIFDVSASMTTGDAYDVAPFVVDDKNGTALRLVTTGLIEPGFVLWGETTCRYLKRDYMYPRVVESDSLSKSLTKRLARARRPKIIVAGLTKRIECFLDPNGEYVGAVSTFSVFHAKDDLDELRALCEELLSDAATTRFVAELGGNAMGGGSITMKKGFLAGLPYRTGQVA